jgi:hypothetical protein
LSGSPDVDAVLTTAETMVTGAPDAEAAAPALDNISVE